MSPTPGLAENTGNVELGAATLVQDYSVNHGLAIYREVTFVNGTSVAENTDTFYHGLAIYRQVTFVNVTSVAENTG